MGQPGFIEGPWQRLEDNTIVSVAAGATFTYSNFFPLKISQEDVLKFGGGGILFGGFDASGKLQLVTQTVYIQMRNGRVFVVPLYPPTQLAFPLDTYVNGSYLATTLPPIEVTGEALGGGGWPTVQAFVAFSVHNTDGTTAHSFVYTYSLPYQIISRGRPV